MKYVIEVEDIPKDCAHCPLAYGHTRDCGKIKHRKSSNANSTTIKVPDLRCKIKAVPD